MCLTIPTLYSFTSNRYRVSFIYRKARKLKLKNWAQIRTSRTVYFPKSSTRYATRKLDNSQRFMFGNSAILPTTTLLLSNRFLLRFDLNLRRIVRKKDKTLRRFWITTRVLFNLSRQSKGSRMGKGKGKNVQHFQFFNPFTNFIELSGVRYGRLIFFLSFLNKRFAQKLLLRLRWDISVLQKQSNFFRNA